MRTAIGDPATMICVRKIVTMGVLLACVPASAWSQVATPSVDSIVAMFLDRRALTQWDPGRLVEGCPTWMATSGAGLPYSRRRISPPNECVISRSRRVIL
jgi:hypothetical protein